MSKTTYNTRTLAACAKRLRWIKDTLPAMPGWAIVWRWREGFRLQVAGEAHEPGGCLWIGTGTDDKTAAIERVEECLAIAQEDTVAEECLDSLLEAVPEGFDDESLRHLSLHGGEWTKHLALGELYRRHEHKHADAVEGSAR